MKSLVLLTFLVIGCGGPSQSPNTGAGANPEPQPGAGSAASPVPCPEAKPEVGSACEAPPASMNGGPDNFCTYPATASSDVCHCEEGAWKCFNKPQGQPPA